MNAKRTATARDPLGRILHAAVTLVVFLAASAAWGGICEGPLDERGSCPARASCRTSGECGAGEACGSGCLPSLCEFDKGWNCTKDCSGECRSDVDADGITDDEDSCPTVANATQRDFSRYGDASVCIARPARPSIRFVRPAFRVSPRPYSRGASTKPLSRLP